MANERPSRPRRSSSARRSARAPARRAPAKPKQRQKRVRRTLPYEFKPDARRVSPFKSLRFTHLQRLQLLRETSGSICVIDRFDDPVAMREFVNAGMLLAGGVCAAFTGSDADGYRYIIGSRTVNLRAEAKAINTAISGRGGGKPTMIQGSCTAPAAAIEAFFAAYPRK